MVYIVGLIVLLVTSLPVSLEHGAGLGGLIAAMIIIGLGTGGIKSNVSPLIAEQYRGTKQTIKTLKSGERVIVDPAVTIQRIYMIFYLCINIGSLSAIATTELELHIDFWAAYLLPTLMFLVGFIVVIAGRKYYVVRPPKGSIVIHAFKALWIGLVNKGNMDAAKPSYQQEYGGKHRISWNDQFIEEIKRALVACRVFVFFPIYWVVYSQMLSKFAPYEIQQNWLGLRPNNHQTISFHRLAPCSFTESQMILCKILIPLRSSYSSRYLIGSSTRSYARSASRSGPSLASHSAFSLVPSPWLMQLSFSTSFTMLRRVTIVLLNAMLVVTGLYLTTSTWPSKRRPTYSSVYRKFLPVSPASNMPLLKHRHP
jgi:POT family